MSRRRRRAADPYSSNQVDNEPPAAQRPAVDRPEADDAEFEDREQTPTERQDGVPLAQLDDRLLTDESDQAREGLSPTGEKTGGLDALISDLIGESDEGERPPTIEQIKAEADQEGLWDAPAPTDQRSVWPHREQEFDDLSSVAPVNDSPSPDLVDESIDFFEGEALPSGDLGDDDELWGEIFKERDQETQPPDFTVSDDPLSMTQPPDFTVSDTPLDAPASGALGSEEEEWSLNGVERGSSEDDDQREREPADSSSWFGRVKKRLAEAEQPDQATLDATEPVASDDESTAAPVESAPSGPTPHCAAREAFLAGANPLPIRLDFDNGVDEINHALSAFADLQYGQTGFIKFSVRSHQGFRKHAGEWLQAKKHGQDIDAERDAKNKFKSWLSYTGSYLWWQAMGGAESKTPAPVSPHKRGEGLKPLGSRASAEEKESWKQTELKMKDSTHYETLIRVGVAGPAEEAEESERIAEEVAGGFNLFETEHQELGWRPADPYDALLGLMPTRQPSDVPMILSARELAGMAHVPDDETNPHGLRVKRSRFKQLTLSNPIIERDPYQPKNGNIPIGRIFPDSDDEKVICMNNSELDKHLLVVGKTGSGKSSWMIWTVFGAAKAGYPIVLVDPHGQLTDDVCKSLIVNCPERVKDIVYCDLADSQWPVAFNPLDIQHRHQIEPTVASINEMLSVQLNLGVGNAPRAALYAQAALTALCSANLVLKDPETKCTLLDVVPFFTNEQFRRMIVEFCDNVAVQQNFDVDHGQFENQPDKAKVDIAQPIVRAFSQLGSSDSFSAVFSAPSNKLSLSRLVTERKLVLIKLSHFSHQAKLGEFVGALVLPWLLSSMDDWGRHKDEITGELTGSGCRVFVDEAPTLFGPTSSAPKVLAEARKYDLGMVMAAQFIDQFPQQIVEASLANTASKIALPIDPNVAASVAKAVAGGSRSVTPADLSQLPNFHYYGNVLLPAPGGLSPSGPFSAACLPPIRDQLDDEGRAMREQVIDQSREQLCNSLDEVRASQRDRLNNIMRALQTRLAERAENTYRPSEIETPSASFDAESGWS